MVVQVRGSKRIEIKPRYDKFAVIDIRDRVIKALNSPEVEKYMEDMQNKGWRLKDD